MLYEVNKEVYIQANGKKYYKLSVDKNGNMKPSKEYLYELPRYNLITTEKAKKLLGIKEDKPKSGIIADGNK